MNIFFKSKYLLLGVTCACHPEISEYPFKIASGVGRKYYNLIRMIMNLPKLALTHHRFVILEMSLYAVGAGRGSYGLNFFLI